MKMPKCNLHSHLEGSLRPTTFLELSLQQGIDLGIAEDQVDDALQVDGTERSLADYLGKISITYQVLKNPEALRRVAFEAAEDATLDGVRYFELRAGPVTHATPYMNVHEAIEAILTGLAEAQARYGIVCRLIVSALRHHDPATNVQLAHAAVDFRGQGVVGFDLAGDEAAYPAHLHEAAFQVARNGGLGITVHAGEAGGPDNVDYAVNVLKATRIGHGIRSIESEHTLGLLRNRQILLEVCPTSNIHTRIVREIDQHPVRRLYEMDIPIGIGDDDPTTSRTRTSQELTLLQQAFHFTETEIREIQRRGLEKAFITDTDTRRQLSDLF